MSLKNTIFLTVLLLFAAACGGNGVNETSTQNEKTEEVMEIDFNTWLPSTHHSVEFAYVPWGEYVEDKTNGKVKVNMHTSGALGGSGTHMEDVQGGAYDVTSGTIGYYTDTDLFKFTMFDLPFAFEDPRDASDAITKFIEANGTDAWPDGVTPSTKGVTTDPYVLFSTKKIRSVEDLKGMKIRVASEVWNPVLKEWGATPVFMPNDELYEALDRGTVDAATYSPIGAVGLKLYEPAPYILNIPMQTISLNIIMNTGTLEKMPEDIRQLFEDDLLPELSELNVKDVENLLGDSIEEMEKLVEGRGEVFTPSPEVLAEFKKGAEPAWDAWVEEANKKGYDGEQLMEEFKQIREELGLE